MHAVEVFDSWSRICVVEAERLRVVDKNFFWTITGDNERHWMYLGGTTPFFREAKRSEIEVADCQIATDAGTLLRIVSTEQSPQAAFLCGDLRVAGELADVLLLNELLEIVIQYNDSHD